MSITEKEIKSFQKNAALCEHLTGEISGEGGEEKERIIKEINKCAVIAKKQFLSLQSKRQKLDAILKQYEEMLAPVEIKP